MDKQSARRPTIGNAAPSSGPGRPVPALEALQAKADCSAGTARLDVLQRSAIQLGKNNSNTTKKNAPTGKNAGEKESKYNSVKFNAFKAAVEMLHPNWEKGTSDNMLTVWHVAQDVDWDLHLTAIKTSMGLNCTKFHFTIRRKRENKGDDAFAWFEFVGHNKKADIGARDNNGDRDYWTNGSAKNQAVSPAIRAHFDSIDGWARAIATTAAEKSA